jgi:hypothetical protein
MPIQNCPLCRRIKPVLKSHFMPAALTEFCSPPGGRPIMITPDIIIESDREIQDYVFCECCEDIFNKGGETWVLPLLARLDAPFPLYDILVKQAPSQVDGEIKIYATALNPEIQADKLIHFAMGIFFKAAVHPWSGSRTEPWINLGPYTEPIRRFLLGETPFPARMCLTAAILPSPTRAIKFSQPYRDSTEGKFSYRFDACGLQFILVVGKGVAGDDRTGCFASNPAHPMILMDFAKALQMPVRQAFDTTRKAKNVEKWLKKL